MRKTLDRKEDFSVPIFHTFPEFLEGIARLYGPRPALSWFTRRKEEKTLSYKELTDKVSALRNMLLEKKLPTGSHIALIGENTADWIITALAVISCGYVAVYVDTEQSDESIRDMVRRSDCRLLFLSGTFLPICLPLLQDGQVSGMILMGSKTTEAGVEMLEDLYAAGAQKEVSAFPQTDPSQTAEIVFTSGTTSQSKMVLLSQGAIMQNICDTGTYVRLYERVFCSLPFYHAYGFNTAVLNSFLRGCHLYINGDLKTTMRDLQLSSPDSMLTVPLMLEAIHNQGRKG